MTLAGSYNGLAFGVAGVDPRLDVITFTGFHDLPGMRSADVPRGNDDGGFSGPDWLDERTVQLGLRVLAADNATYLAQLQAIKAAFTRSATVELPLYLWDSTRLIYCRVRKRSIPEDTLWRATFGEAQMELVASDPRIYDVNLLTATVPVAVASGGRTYPRLYPLTYGVTGGGGTFQMTNIGGYASKATAHIAGPIDSPRIEATDQGRKVQLAISLGATDFLDIDFKSRSIVLNGQASRRSALTSDSAWFDVQPGLNNLRFAESTATAGGVLTFSFRSAWI